MSSIKYIGEHLLAGQLGHLAIVIGFIASLFSFICYQIAQKNRNNPQSDSWLKLGRWAFYLQSISVFVIISTIFVMMTNQFYEYEYVRLHVSDQLPMKYVAAAFWEGQEGSFLLWMFWHTILGLVAVRFSGKWESGVLGTLVLIQVFLYSMILGVYLPFTDIKFGSSPFLLVRDIMDAPIFAKADYVSLLKGNGLNPLLQNYWMTIHPPTLFLGFASVTMPFAYAVAALQRKDYSDWLKNVMPWALFSAAILGTGILMGGAWAYEALSFGGYWAWDPVENMSLVPWLILLAGIHTNLIASATGHSIRAVFGFYLLSFCLVLYSTFLTRSGVLGDTSVHAFTEMGLESQLLLFLLFYCLYSLYLYIRNFKSITRPAKEEHNLTREFWMFIGALILLFSSILISFTTSLPVYNKLMDTAGSLFGQDFSKLHRTAPLDAVGHYNKFQLWIAVFIALLSSFSLFLRYKSPLQRTQMRKIVMRLSVHLIIAGALTFVSTYFIKLPSWQFVVLMIAGIFSVSSCLDYLIFYAKQSMKKAGSGLSHLGFGLLIIGVLGSGLNKRHISSNPLTMRGLLGDETLGKNILLFKNLPMYMNGYEVTYKQDTLNQFYRTYTINYVRKDSTGEVKENFDLHPNVVYDRSMQKIAATNPATHHYWDKDIFTHIAQLPNEQMDEASGKAKEDSLKYKLFFGTVGQKQPLQKGNFEAKKIYFNPIHPDYASQEGDLAIGVDYEFRDTILDTAYVASPVIVLREGMVYNFPAVVNSMGIKVKLSDTIYNSLLGEKNKLELGRFEMQSGDSTTFQDLSVKFSAFVKQPSHPDYKAEKGDVAVGADFEIRQGNGEPVHVNPVYLIRAGAVTDFPVFLTALGAEIRFTGINPEKETVTLELRKWNTSQLDIAADVAQNYSRADFIVLEAILFPGINLFWLGSILMMFGLALSFIDKRKMVRSNG